MKITFLGVGNDHGFGRRAMPSLKHLRATCKGLHPAHLTYKVTLVKFKGKTSVIFDFTGCKFLLSSGLACTYAYCKLCHAVLSFQFI